MARGTRDFGSNKVLPVGEVLALREEFNKVLAELDALYAKLDADGGVTGTDFASTLVSAKKVE